MARHTILLPDDQSEWLEQMIAVNRGDSLSHLVRLALDKLRADPTLFLPQSPSDGQNVTPDQAEQQQQESRP